MIGVEDAAGVVIEQAECNSQTRVPVAAVRDAHEQCAARTEPVADLIEGRRGVSNVFEHVGRDDDVEIVTGRGGNPFVEIALVELGDALAYSGGFAAVDADDVMAGVAETGAE